jgi:hypothetical protein
MDTAKLKIDPVAWDPDERYVWYDHHFIGAVKPAASGTGYDVLAPGDKPGEPSLHISHANSHVDGAEQLARRWLARQDEKKAAAEPRAPKNPRKKPIEKTLGGTTRGTTE